MIRNAYRSRLGGLWTDRCDAVPLVMEQLRQNQITPEEAGQLMFWIKYGYLLIKNAVPSEVVDQLNSDLDRAWQGQNPVMKLDVGGQHLPISLELREQKTKLLDFYVFSEAAIKAIFSEPIANFLKMIFKDDPLVFQSLNFEYSTEQMLHQDTAYVVVDSPLEMAISWIALEDVQEGSGEVFCYERSHQIKEFMFAPNRRFWNPEEDHPETHNQFLKYLNSEIQKLNLPQKVFRVNKGDALIFTADLVYGEQKIIQNGLTRKSIISHYCPNHCMPRYFQFLPKQAHRTPYKGYYYSTSLY